MVDQKNTDNTKGTANKNKLIDITALLREEEIESLHGEGAINLVFKLYDGNLYAMQLCTELSLYHDKLGQKLDENHPLKLLMKQNRKGADIVKFFTDHSQEGDVHEKAVEHMYHALLDNQANVFSMLQEEKKPEHKE